jgi:hypothetical protein
VTAALREAAAVVVDHVHLQARKPACPGPVLGAVEEARADPEPARVRVNRRLVLDVREVALRLDAQVPDELAVPLCNPGAVLDGRVRELPPLAQQPAGQRRPSVLAEVEAVTRGEKRCNCMRIVERRRAYGELVQSGWPDSNRRLLAPKASTLTRLSYTPNLGVSVERRLSRSPQIKT